MKRVELTCFLCRRGASTKRPVVDYTIVSAGTTRPVCVDCRTQPFLDAALLQRMLLEQVEAND